MGRFFFCWNRPFRALFARICSHGVFYWLPPLALFMLVGRRRNLPGISYCENVTSWSRTWTVETVLQGPNLCNVFAHLPRCESPMAIETASIFKMAAALILLLLKNELRYSQLVRPLARNALHLHKRSGMHCAVPSWVGVEIYRNLFCSWYQGTSRL